MGGAYVEQQCDVCNKIVKRKILRNHYFAAHGFYHVVLKDETSFRPILISYRDGNNTRDSNVIYFGESPQKKHRRG